MNSFLSKVGAYYEEQKADKQDREVYQFLADMFLVKDNHSIDEGYKDASPSNHRDNGNHGAGERQRVEIGDIGSR